MDPNNYKIHKRPRPSYIPDAQTVSNRRQYARTVPPQTQRRSTGERRSTPRQPTLSRTSGANVSAPQPQVIKHSELNTGYQTPLPKPVVAKPEYTYQVDSDSQPKKPKSKLRKRFKIFIIVILIILFIGGCSAGAYYYYLKNRELPATRLDTKEAVAGVRKESEETEVDFTLYRTKKGSLFKSDSKYSNGRQNSWILTANSIKDKRQVVLTQQKVDNYFTTDPNGLDKLLQSVGENKAVPIKNGMSYIVKGGVTALTVKEQTLVIVRSTGELSNQEWIELFDSLESVS